MIAADRLPEPRDLEAVALRARALAHPARLRILALLEGREICVCQITEIIDLAPATISAHLRQLRLAGLVEQTRRGRWIWFRLSASSAVVPWLRLALDALEGDPLIARDRLCLEQAVRSSGDGGCSITPLAPSKRSTP